MQILKKFCGPPKNESIILVKLFSWNSNAIWAFNVNAAIYVSLVACRHSNNGTVISFIYLWNLTIQIMIIGYVLKISNLSIFLFELLSTRAINNNQQTRYLHYSMLLFYDKPHFFTLLYRFTHIFTTLNFYFVVYISSV